jgi:hypothetical protein
MVAGRADYYFRFFRKSQSQLTSKGSYKEIEEQKGILMPTDWKNLFSSV